MRMVDRARRHTIKHTNNSQVWDHLSEVSLGIPPTELLDSDRQPRGELQDLRTDRGVCASEPGLVSGSEQWTACPRGHRGYGSPLGPEENIWYHSRGRRARQIAQLPQPSVSRKYLTNGDFGVDCVQVELERISSSLDR